MPPVASTAVQAIFEGLHEDASRSGRTDARLCIRRAQTQHACACCACAGQHALTLIPEHFVLVSSAHEGGCKWGFGFILVRSKTPRVERDSIVTHENAALTRARVCLV